MTIAKSKRAAGWRALFARESRPPPRWEAIVRAYADTLFPPDGPIPISGSEAGAVEFMRNYLARSQPRQRRLIRLLFEVSELGPLVFGPQRRRFTHLTRKEREAYLAAGFSSRLYLRRVVVLTMRTLLTMAYFANDDVLRCMGIRYDRDPFGLDTPTPKASETRLRDDAVVPDDLQTVA